MELPDDLTLTLQRESLEKNPARELIVRKINAHIRNETLNQARFRKHLIDLHQELYGMFGITMPIFNLVAIIDATSLFSLCMPSQYLAPARNENGTPARFVHNGKRYLVVGSSKNGIELSQKHTFEFIFSTHLKKIKNFNRYY